ncbi:hypothetical protein, partial [Klebsiella pneumoniae]|uniref:hypothetical protein n=2 Tax=Klebsiella pneumoniae TaxID=573 RepID=UPI0031EAA402
MKGMTVIVLMWEEAAIKDDVIEYDIAFNIIYIMRTSAQISPLGKNLLPDTRKKQTAPRVDMKACHRRSPFCHT